MLLAVELVVWLHNYSVPRAPLKIRQRQLYHKTIALREPANTRCVTHVSEHPCQCCAQLHFTVTRGMMLVDSM